MIGFVIFTLATLAFITAFAYNPSDYSRGDWDGWDDIVYTPEPEPEDELVGV